LFEDQWRNLKGLENIGGSHQATPPRAKKTAMRQDSMKEIELESWEEFERVLRYLQRDFVLVRSFQRVTFDNIESPDHVEVDSLAVARQTGTDRRENAHMWNATGFDHEHDRVPSGKKPNEIIYAFLVDLRQHPYLVSVADGSGGASFQVLDLTDDYTEHNAVLVYDPDMLERVSPNEYWFKVNPLTAALLLLTTKQVDDA
jgi:hypothetical protein